MQHHARVYFKEAKWFHENYVPTIEEYMPLALETTGYGLLPISSFIGMGGVATKDAFEWLLTEPKIIRGAKMVCRLMDDIVSHKVQSPQNPRKFLSEHPLYIYIYICVKFIQLCRTNRKRVNIRELINSLSLKLHI